MTDTREIRFGEEDHAALFELEASSFWFRARNELILWAIARYFGRGPGRYLELGCGTGFVLQAIETRFPDLALVGSEGLAAGLERAALRVRRAELRQLDARALPYAGEFELVGAYDVLEHIPEDDEALEAIARTLVPGGWVFLTVPQHRWLWGPSDDYARHVRRYTRAELAGKLAAAGLVPVRLTSFVALLLPMLVASRLLQMLRPRAYRPEAEFGLPPLLDRAFEQIMAVERACLARGLDFPAGGSLLAIARKPAAP